MAELEKSCCSPQTQATCCEPSDKAECCDPQHGDSERDTYSRCGARRT